MLEYMHSLTHRIWSENLSSIIKKGLQPGGRAVHLSCFPTDLPIRGESSRSRFPVLIVLKMRSLLFELADCGMWCCGVARNSHCEVSITPQHFWAIFLAESPNG